jgi:hypothetical protein
MHQLLASLLLELVLGPMPLSWGLLRSRKEAFESQPVEEDVCKGALSVREMRE